MQSIVQSVYHSSNPFNIRPHFHDCHQIILILKGSVALWVNGRRLTAKAGDAVVFSRYENHSIHAESEEYERYILHIDPDVVNRKSPVYLLLTDRPAGFCNVIDVSARMEEAVAAFERIMQEHGSAEKLADDMEQLAVKQLLITLYRCTPVDFDNAYDHIVVDMKRRFENNCQQRYTLDALAEEYSVSVSSLSHRFQAETGMSVMAYLQFCRIADAKQLLAHTDSSIGTVVEKCGFSDNSNFSRIFKRLTGLSPTQFRKKYQ